MSTIQDVTAAVTAQATVEDSVLTMLNGLVDQMKAAKATNDSTAMDAILTEIEANTAKLQAAVTANTVVAPVTVVP